MDEEYVQGLHASPLSHPQLAASNDPLAHPLSSSSPVLGTSSPTGRLQPSVPTTSPSPPRYVPYTPRQQRPVTSTISPSIAHPSASLSQGSGPTATGKLQLQSLKAAAQTIGLDNASVGWMILEKLFSPDLEGTDWDVVWHLIADGQATLLLPSEQASPSLILTPEFVQDHVALTANSRKDIVTLGGLRGTIDKNAMQIRSAISTSSDTFRGLQRNSSRTQAFNSLPPLSAGQDESSPYPSYSSSERLLSLHIPPRPFPSNPPPLPPRPAPTSNPGLSGRFASLFGTTKSSASVPPRASSPQPPPSIRSEASVESVNPYATEGHTVIAYVIDKPIIRKDISKAVTKALKAHLKSQLAGLPKWVTERVLSFTMPFQPLAKSDSSSLKSQSSTLDSTPPNSSRAPQASHASTVVNIAGIQEIADSIQDFYEALEDELRKEWTSKSNKRRAASGDDSVKESGDSPTSIDEPRPANGDELDERLRAAMDQVEESLTSVFYDHLVSPAPLDDTVHDEALANRIAALNMNDLDWDHLGIQLDPADKVARSGIDEIIASCGREMQMLHDNAHRSAKSKADVIVSVHKIVVDGLATLPPLRLTPDGEPAQKDAGSGPVNPKAPEVDHSAITHANGDPQSDVAGSIPPTTYTKPTQPIAINSTSSADADPELPSPVVASQMLISGTTGLNIVSIPADFLPNTSSNPQAVLDSAKPRSTAVSSDVLLPVLIYAVVKANPVQLASQLLFIQRFRNRCSVRGEESFCLINFLGVVEFLEHVDMKALGSGESGPLMTVQELSPLLGESTDPKSPLNVSAQARIRGRVEQQVGDFATGATRVISGVGGVVDSSFSALRGLLNTTPDSVPVDEEGRIINSPAAVVSAIITRPGFGLLKRGTSFTASVASNVAASLPGATKEKKSAAEVGQPMLEVNSRPGSLRHVGSGESSGGEESSDESTNGSDDETSSESGGEDDDVVGHRVRTDKSDTRSIRSFSSMMSGDRERPRGRDKDKTREQDRLEVVEDKRERASLSERLAAMPALARLSNPNATSTPHGSRRSSLLVVPAPHVDGSSTSADVTADIPRITPPNPRFLQCSADELRLGEVPALLAEYRRVVEALRNLNGFQNP